jgi:hypothetical protein
VHLSTFGSSKRKLDTHTRKFSFFAVFCVTNDLWGPCLFFFFFVLQEMTTGMARPLRPLRPAAARPRNEPLPPQPRDRVASACDQCRTRKIKCNGERPTCLECTKRSTSCHYATQSAETQNQALKRKFKLLQAENEAYAELFELIKTSSDSESRELMLRVKMGGEVEDVLKRIKEAESFIQSNPRLDDASRAQYVLPSLASVVPKKRMFMPDNPYFASSSGSQAEFYHRKSSESSDTAAQYPSPPV